jgi:hypothetical protein
MTAAFVPAETAPESFIFSGPFQARGPGRCAWSGLPFGTNHKIRLRLRVDANGIATIPDGAILADVLGWTSTRQNGADVYRMDRNADAFAAAVAAAPVGATFELTSKIGKTHRYERREAGGWRKNISFGRNMSERQVMAEAAHALFFRPVFVRHDGPVFAPPAPAAALAPAVRPLADVMADLAAADKEVEQFHPAWTGREMTDADREGMTALRTRIDRLHCERLDAR